jgi:hypothetical protein
VTLSALCPPCDPVPHGPCDDAADPDASGPASFKVSVLPPVAKVVIPPVSAIRHRVRPLPRVPLSEILEPHNAEFLSGRSPFKLVNFTKLSPSAFAAQWDFDYFAKAFRDHVVDFYVRSTLWLWGRA